MTLILYFQTAERLKGFVGGWGWGAWDFKAVIYHYSGQAEKKQKKVNSIKPLVAPCALRVHTGDQWITLLHSNAFYSFDIFCIVMYFILSVYFVL